MAKRKNLINVMGAGKEAHIDAKIQLSTETKEKTKMPTDETADIIDKMTGAMDVIKKRIKK